MVHTFTYTECEIGPSTAFPNGHTTMRPILPVTLMYGAQTWDCFGIVDTGADYIEFPKSYMEKLGIAGSATKSTLALGVGESATCHHVEVLMSIEGLFDEKVDVGFTEGLDHWEIGILGWRGFLEHMDASFVPRINIFTLDDARLSISRVSSEL
jgi:hypothetical protein